jgi:hypothetical protein
MRFSKRWIRTALLLGLGVGALVGCASEQAGTNPQTEAINEIRMKLRLPDLPLTLVETTEMVNSPDGNLQVALYQDSEGRKYSVEPKCLQVVEIDAREFLASISQERPAVPRQELRETAKDMVMSTTPDFEARVSGLTYDEGNKEENYFYTWRDDAQSGTLNRPFAQIGLHVSGELFAYYNTLTLK